MGALRTTLCRWILSGASPLWLAACWPAPLVRLASDAGIDAAATGAFQSLAPCRTVSDYESTTTTIDFGGQGGNSYSPRCLTVQIGTGVTFQGQFSQHPLHPSLRGSPGTPITVTTSGASASFVFSAAGFFPFYCDRHGDDSGGGMAGVIQVVP